MNRAERRKLEKNQKKADGGQTSIQVSKKIQAPLNQAINSFQAGQFQQAEAACRQVLNLDSGQFIALNLLGLIARQMGNLEAATQLVTRSISSNPTFVEAHNNLGNLKMESGLLEEAASCFQKSVSIRKDVPDSYYNLSVAQLMLGDVVEAFKSCSRALSLKPDYAEAHNNLGNILSKQGLKSEATNSFRKAISINPGFADAYANLSAILSDTHDLEEALVFGLKALSLRPNQAEVLTQLGVTYNRLGRYQEALECHEKALTIKPDYSEALNNLSMVQLMTGNFRDGWKNFQSRRTIAGNNLLTVYPDFNAPQWSGEDLGGQRILVWGEQGIGDQVLFCSMIPDLIQMRAKVVLQCEDRLVPLFSRSFPEITCVTKAGLLNLGDLEFDYHSPIGHLGGELRRDPSVVSRQSSFLSADPAQIHALRQRYLSHGNPVVVGIAWHSSGAIYGERKSMTLTDLQPSLEIPGVTYVDLQYGNTEQEREAFRSDTGIEIVRDSAVDQMVDVDLFAAQVASMDHVITISNTTAHMAGAMGVPCSVMLGRAPLWYWQLDREDCLWYPSVRLFRQSNWDDWSGVVERVTGVLSSRVT